MRLLALLALVVLSGCGLFQPRPVQIDPTPELLALRAELEAGRLGQVEFERQVSAMLGATVTEIKADWSATAVSIAEDAARGAVAGAEKAPVPISPGGWLALLGSIVAGGISAGAANARLKRKPEPGTVVVTTTPAVVGGGA